MTTIDKNMEDAVPQKINNRITIWSRNPTSGYAHRRNKSKEKNQIPVHPCSQQDYPRPTQSGSNLSVRWQTNGQTKCGPFIQWNVLQPKKEGISDTGYHLDEPWRHHAQWNQPVQPEGQIPQDSTYERYLEWSDPWRQKGGFQGRGERRVSEEIFGKMARWREGMVAQQCECP